MPVSTFDCMPPTRREKHSDKYVYQPHDIANVFKALGDPTRLRILFDLAKSDSAVHQLSSSLNMTQTSISHHLRQLRAQNLVVTHRSGREIFYMLANDLVMTMVETAKRHVEEN